jgi:hypothetical protein
VAHRQAQANPGSSTHRSIGYHLKHDDCHLPGVPDPLSRRRCCSRRESKAPVALRQLRPSLALFARGRRDPRSGGRRDGDTRNFRFVGRSSPRARCAVAARGARHSALTQPGRTNRTRTAIGRRRVAGGPASAQRDGRRHRGDHARRRLSGRLGDRRHPRSRQDYGDVAVRPPHLCQVPSGRVARPGAGGQPDVAADRRLADRRRRFGQPNRSVCRCLTRMVRSRGTRGH